MNSSAGIKTASPPWLTLALIAAWASIVLISISHHEFWRDEVYPLSLAREASSLFDLLAVSENYGHPALWTFLLYAGYSLTGANGVLPALAFTIGLASIVLFYFRAPFPLWFKTLFAFSLPLYEYTVSARNYGISMLLMICFAGLYGKRKAHPYALGILLALLCNTNVHSMLLAGLLMCIWLWDSFVGDRPPLASPAARKIYISAGLVLGGAAVSLYTVWPSATLLTSDLSGYSLAGVFSGFLTTLGNPAGEFTGLLFPPSLRHPWLDSGSIAAIEGALATALLLFPAFGLFRQPPLMLAALCALFGLSIFSIVVFNLEYRHQGLFIVFLIALYWIGSEGAALRRQPRLSGEVFRFGIKFILPLMLALLVVREGLKTLHDFRLPVGAALELAKFIQTRPDLRQAILIGEPGYFLMSLPYYADNRLYFVRDRRFASHIEFTNTARLDMTLGQLTCAAIALQQQEKKPVLIAIGHIGFETSQNSTRPYEYARTFSWTGIDKRLFAAATRHLRTFAPAISGESYALYRIVDPPPESRRGCPE